MYVVEILVPLKDKREDFFDFRNVKISPKDKDGCATSPQMFTGNEDNSSNFRRKSNNPPLSGRLLTACSIKAPAGNSAAGNRLSCAWKVNKKTNAGVQHWLTSGSAFSWHIWVALPCSAPQKHFKWCGSYFMWKNKVCCKGLKGILLLFHPSFKLLFKSRLY